MVEIQLFLRQLVRELIIKCHIQYLHRICTRLVFCVNGQYCFQTHMKKKKKEEEEEEERTNHSKYYPLEIECHILTLSVHLYRRIRICLLHF